MFKKTLLISFTLAFILASCASPSPAVETMGSKTDESGDTMDKTEAAPEEMMEKPPEKPDEMTKEGAGDYSMADEMADPPAWFSAEFADARTGQLYTIEGFKGQVVLVETMAMWCPNCKKQQGQVVMLREMLARPDSAVFIGLDVDVNENINNLKSYVESNGFDWYYSVTTPETAREIGNLYGDQFLNPSSTPMLIIDREGKVHPLPFGIKSAEDLQKALEPFVKNEM